MNGDGEGGISGYLVGITEGVSTMEEKFKSMIPKTRYSKTVLLHFKINSQNIRVEGQKQQDYSSKGFTTYYQKHCSPSLCILNSLESILTNKKLPKVMVGCHLHYSLLPTQCRRTGIRRPYPQFYEHLQICFWFPNGFYNLNNGTPQMFSAQWDNVYSIEGFPFNS